MNYMWLFIASIFGGFWYGLVCLSHKSFGERIPGIDRLGFLVCWGAVLLYLVKGGG